MKYYKSKTHTTLYKARNLALNKAKGSIITFLDTDDFLIRIKLLIQLRHFKLNKCEISYTNLNIYKNNTIVKKNYFGKLYSGFITQNLLNNYKVGIITSMVNKEFLQKINLILTIKL